MNFFTLQITTPSKGLIYETDIEPGMFDSLARLFAGQLVNHNVFYEKEYFLARLVPRWSGQPRFDHADLLDARQLPPPTRPFLDLTFDEPFQPDPISYLTLRLHSGSRPIVYEQDFSIESLLQMQINLAVSRLLETKVMQEGESFKIVLLARTEGKPSIDANLLSRPAVYTYVMGNVNKMDSDSAVVQERPKSDIKITIKDKKALIVPRRKSPSSYRMVEALGKVKPGALRVYVRRRSWLGLRDAVKISKVKQVEVAGVLLGNVFKDDEGEQFVEVSELIPVPEAQGDFYNVRIDSEVWRGIIENVNVKYPDRDRILVGWYHTHLVSKLNMTSMSGGAMQASQQTFLSGEDVFIHDNFFQQPWHVALVVDLNNGQDVFFYRNGKQLQDCEGFYLFEDSSA
jgi:hypothetical protein